LLLLFVAAAHVYNFNASFNSLLFKATARSCLRAVSFYNESLVASSFTISPFPHPSISNPALTPQQHVARSNICFGVSLVFGLLDKNLRILCSTQREGISILNP